MCEEVASRVVEVAMGPVYQSLGSMAGDLVVQVGGNALGVQNGVDLGQTAKAGQEGLNEGIDSVRSGGAMQLAGANGSGGSGGQGGGSGRFSMDPESYESAGVHLKGAGGKIRDGAGGKLTRARSTHGRTKGKDAIADAANGMLDQVMDGIGKSVKRSADHLTENMPGGLNTMAKRHRANDDEIALSLSQLRNAGAADGTPVYLMSDDGTLRRLRPDGGHDKLTDEDRSRIGLTFDGDNVGRPQAGEPNLILQGKDRPRPLSKSERVDLGSTELSRAVQLARHADNSYGTHRKTANGGDKFESNNYAAARFDSKGEGGFIIVGRSSGYRHSERMIGFPVLRDGAGGRMTELYTERAPCPIPPNCSAWMKERLPHVDVTHSIDYGDTRASRVAGNTEMMDYLDRLKANRNK